MTISKELIKRIDYGLNEFLVILETYEMSVFFCTTISEGLSNLINALKSEYDDDEILKSTILKITNFLDALEEYVE